MYSVSTYHEPFSVHFRSTEVKKVWRIAELQRHRNPSVLGIIMIIRYRGRDHDNYSIKGVIPRIERFDEAQRAIKEPLRYDQCDFYTRGIPRRIQLGSMNNVFRPKMARNEIGSSIVMDGFGKFIWYLVLPANKGNGKKKLRSTK